jgi:WD40 repeat protein
LRIYDVMNPTAIPTQYTVSTKTNESATKILFVPNNSSLLFVGTKNSLIQLWDRRLSPTTACVTASSLLTSDETSMPVMDIEINRQSETILTTIGRKVLMLSAQDGSILKEWSMPDPLSFREEGGTSMHPDGTRFMTVSD